MPTTGPRTSPTRGSTARIASPIRTATKAMARTAGASRPATATPATAPSIPRRIVAIAPTAALSAMPYTQQESMATLRYFYEELGGEIWGRHGFVDAFNRSQGWVANKIGSTRL